MLTKLIHIYRSLKSFKIHPVKILFLHLKKDRPKDPSEYISKSDFSGKTFSPWILKERVETTQKFNEILAWHVSKWCDHQFDLLGTGWVSRNKGSDPCTFLGFTVPEEKDDSKIQSHSIISKRALGQIDSYYSLIDWHIDIKSGFRWDPEIDSDKQIPFWETPYGVDVKIPWELARMNHLPLLILYAHINISEQEKIIREFKNFVSDFIANNPEGKGINWNNAMEVSIRAVNMLLAFELAQKIDQSKILDRDFQSVFFDSVFEHCHFILENPEYKKGHTNNHYYSNISALLFIGYYFRQSPGGRNLINVAAHEVFRETKKQFLEDGGNFEASTHYHRLSTEMLLWNCIILGRSQNEGILSMEFPIWNNPKIQNPDFGQELETIENYAYRALEFSLAIRKPNGNIASCGDQDSGRYIKMGFAGDWMSFADLQKEEKQYQLGHYQWKEDDVLWLENDLNHDHLLVFGQGILNESDMEKQTQFPLESLLSEQLRFDQSLVLPPKKPKAVKFGDQLFWHTSTIFYPEVCDSIRSRIEWFLFPDFGIYIAKSDDFFLSVNATNNHLPKYWSHGKNDKLSFELQIKGKDVITDPGSFIYSADNNLRNKFRSTAAHSTISVGGKEQNRWPEGKSGTFAMYNESKSSFLAQIDNSISLLCEYRGIKHIRTFKIHNDHLEIIDECNREFETHFNYSGLRSDHYGRWKILEKES